ncbi:hypothetical protein NDA01_15875 [Trichocoleus desertorum AS-A10]|uniref:hypothetical protein n=1 Tax=Trichocoleus desertorum TaxID=1481672 RepID=UPI003298704D
MKLVKIILVLLVFLVNLAIAPASWADKPKVSKNHDYVEMTRTLNRLFAERDAQGNSPELKQQIDELQLQKAAIESGITWGQCRNETGQTLAIYGPAGEESKSGSNALYFLADGETTPEGWDCNGVYLPNDVQAAGIPSSPAVFKILDGTRLVAKTNPDTSEIVFNVPPVQDSPAKDLSIPNVSQTFINSRIPSPLAAGEIDD